MKRNLWTTTGAVELIRFGFGCGWTTRTASVGAATQIEFMFVVLTTRKRDSSHFDNAISSIYLSFCAPDCKMMRAYLPD